MLETEIYLGRGIARHLAYCDNTKSNLSHILQEFGYSKDDLVDISITYNELCEIHSLAKALHESVKKLK